VKVEQRNRVNVEKGGMLIVLVILVQNLFLVCRRNLSDQHSVSP